MNIVEALNTLDPKNDDQWTADGLPRMDVVEGLVGDKSITRADVTNAAPDFTRETAADVPDPDPAAGEDAVPTPDAANEAADLEPDANAGLDEAADLEPETDFTIADTDAKADAKAEAEPEAEESMSGMKLRQLGIPTAKALQEMPYGELEEERKRLTSEMLQAQNALEEIKKVADALANGVNALNGRISHMEKADPNHGTAGVRAYLEQQNKNRVQRAQGMNKFIESTGLHPKDVANATDPKAPIDRAMGARKPARGSARPRY